MPKSFSILCGILAALATAVSAQPGMVPGKVLVEFRSPSKGTVDAARASAAVGGSVERIFGRGRYGVLGLPKTMIPQVAARRLGRQFEIVAAAPVYVRRIVSTIPNDPLFANCQWALNNTGQLVDFGYGPVSGTPDADIDAPEAWDVTTGSGSAVVAVIDTGIGLANPDLAPNAWVNTGEIPGNSVDDDVNGYVDDVNGYNFVANTASPQDDHGHGSFCSGIIGARGNNSNAVCGVNWQVQIMALKAFDSSGNGTDEDLVEAIDYAAANGARVINASWGDWIQSPVVDSAIGHAGEQGVVFVAAAGNDGENLKEHPFYPACSSLPNLISVGSTNFTDSWSSFSNFDDTLLDVFAPGENVYSTRAASTGWGSGTSYATPHVAGIAALLLVGEPTLQPARMRDRVKAGVEARSKLQDRSPTGGRASAFLALVGTATDPNPPAAVGDFSIVRTGSNGFELSFMAPGDDGSVGKPAFYDVRISTSPIDAGNFHSCERVHHIPPAAAAGSMVTFHAPELEPATGYFLRMVTCDEAGNTSALSNQVMGTTADRSVFFSDDMESGDAKWSVTGTWTLTTETARRGEWCWTESPGSSYGKDVVATLTSLPIDLQSAVDPWLRFHHQFLFQKAGSTFYDGGELQVSTDGTLFTTIAYYYHSRHPWSLENVSLAEYAGMSTVQIRFRFHSNATQEFDGWHIDDVEIYQPVTPVPEPADFVVESRLPFSGYAVPGYDETTSGGAWVNSASKAVDAHCHQVGARYKTILVLGSTARFTPLVPVEGRYEVFAIWGISANASNVRYGVSHALGNTDTYLTQNAFTNSNQWISLGTYEFARGRSVASGSVLVDDSTVSGQPIGSSEGRVYSDAIRFVYRGPRTSTVADWRSYSR